jgi:hypothetical protein
MPALSEPRSGEFAGMPRQSEERLGRGFPIVTGNYTTQDLRMWRFG